MEKDNCFLPPKLCKYMCPPNTEIHIPSYLFHSSIFGWTWTAFSRTPQKAQLTSEWEAKGRWERCTRYMVSKLLHRKMYLLTWPPIPIPTHVHLLRALACVLFGQFGDSGFCRGFSSLYAIYSNVLGQMIWGQNTLVETLKLRFLTANSRG